jgi:hypothetical protein
MSEYLRPKVTTGKSVIYLHGTNEAEKILLFVKIPSLEVVRCEQLDVFDFFNDYMAVMSADKRTLMTYKVSRANDDEV